VAAMEVADPVEAGAHSGPVDAGAEDSEALE